ncbi:MAG: FecR domain-containing protein [Saprospiraceae bacterium]|nr:FecR domain-containing protein [Saprospiraceae bacterium]
MEEKYLLLLSKRCTGEINAEESAALDHWLRQSPENEQFATATLKAWEIAGTYGKTFTPSLDADFQKVMAKIKAQHKTEVRVSWRRPVLRVAAAIALLIGALWGWQQFGASQTNEIIVSADQLSGASKQLPDGSVCWLNNGSQLRYTTGMSDESRLVTLEGEAYFEVAHDPARPFKVSLQNGGSVEVLGTQFDVRQTDTETAVIVRSGKVRFVPAGQTDGPVLLANQKAVYDRNQAKIHISVLNSLNELAWQTGGLEFVNTPLSQVVKDLERFYGVHIELQNPNMSGCPHSAPLTNLPIEKVLASLALTHQLKVKKSGDRSYVLSGGVCR